MTTTFGSGRFNGSTLKATKSGAQTTLQAVALRRIGYGLKTNPMSHSITTKSGAVLTSKSNRPCTYAVVVVYKSDGYEAASFFLRLDLAEKQLRFYQRGGYRGSMAAMLADCYIVPVST